MVDIEELRKMLVIDLSSEFNTNVICQLIPKNNVTKTAIIIKQNDSVYSPTLYLEDIYQHYQDVMSYDVVLKQVVRGLKDAINHAKDSNLNPLECLDISKTKMKIVNQKKNKDWLDTVPHRTVEDLAIVYYIPVDMADGYGSIVINNEVLGYLNSDGQLSESDLYDIAYKNVSEDVEVINMNDILLELGMPSYMIPQPSTPMIVVTNKHRLYGAISLTLTDVLDKIAQDNDTDALIVIPSSIHECIVLPDDDNMDLEQLPDIVANVNLTEVTPEDVLSDNIYLYTSKDKCLKIYKR